MKTILKDILNPCNIFAWVSYQEEKLILTRLRSIQSPADGTSWEKNVNIDERNNVVVGGEVN